MNPSTPRPAALSHAETYSAADRPGVRPAAGLTRPVDIDRRPAGRPDSEPQAELSFADLLDVINPLQHIPVVGDLYRYLTGDRITGPARVAGAALFGGPIGFVAGLANAIVAEANGGNPGEAALAALFGDDEPGVAVAAESDAAAETAAVAQSPAQDRLQPVLAAYGAPAGQAPLTGAAALQALGADLRGAGGNAVSALPIRPALASNSSAASIDARHLTPPSGSAFSVQVLEGLDKYKAMGASRSRTLDETL
jgi:hypothetical protein